MRPVDISVDLSLRGWPIDFLGETFKLEVLGAFPVIRTENFQFQLKLFFLKLDQLKLFIVSEIGC